MLYLYYAVAINAQQVLSNPFAVLALFCYRYSIYRDVGEVLSLPGYTLISDGIIAFESPTI